MAALGAAGLLDGATLLSDDLATPRAATVATLGWQCLAAGRSCTPEEIRPLYVRVPECEEVYETRRAAARARRV